MSNMNPSYTKCGPGRYHRNGRKSSKPKPIHKTLTARVLPITPYACAVDRKARREADILNWQNSTH